MPIYNERYIVFEDDGNLNVGTNLTIAIYRYTGVTDYAVKDSNPRYTSVNGIIYSKDMTHVVAIPARYNKWVWKIGTMALILFGLLMIGYGVSTF